MTGEIQLNETELYKELGKLTKEKDKWRESIPYVSSLLEHDSAKIQAKALWLLGEMGLKWPREIACCVSWVTAFLNSADPLLRERALNAFGRIGRADFELIRPYWKDMFRFAKDGAPNVRLNFATNSPQLYADFMSIFAGLLHDTDDKVRMEAPEIFRVIGKRRPEFVKPYIELLTKISETDTNRVVRIHSRGAIKAFNQGQSHAADE